MAGIVALFIFIMCSLSIIESHRLLKTKLPKVSARRDGQGVSAEVPSCIPGEFYRGHNCEQCFCSDKGFRICTVPLTCKMDEKEPTRDELIHIFNPAIDLSHLPEVHDAAAKCKPGKAYRMDCNRCICTRTKSLICEKLLCPSYDDVNRDTAKEMSGGPCETGDKINQDCIKCSCKKGSFACDFKRDCIPPKPHIFPINGQSNPVVQTLGKKKKCVPGQKYLDQPGKPPCICTHQGKLQCPKALSRPRTPRPFDPAFLDPRSGKKCVPGVFYKKDCNKCTCSQKRLLRCTTMTCLKKNGKLARLLKRRPRLPALQEKTVRPKRLRGKKLLDPTFSDSNTEERRRIWRSLEMLKKSQNETVKELPFDDAFLDGTNKCQPGVTYYKQCNKCSCTQEGSLICTTMVCSSVQGVQILNKHDKLGKEQKKVHKKRYEIDLAFHMLNMNKGT